jgi:hypothetical protein
VAGAAAGAAQEQASAPSARRAEHLDDRFDLRVVDLFEDAAAVIEK